MNQISAQADAAIKINLALHVTGQREDGYHELDSVVVFAQPGDRIELTPAKADEIEPVGQFAHQLKDHADNLVLRARDLFRASFPHIEHAPTTIRLEKNLPVASGIGGGSADAAATLRLLAEQVGVRSDDMIIEIAMQLGADVPMCLSPAPKRVTGIGDQIAPILQLPAFHILLINPLVELPTPTVFQALTRRQNPPLPGFNDGWNTVDELVSWLQHTRNDLEGPAIKLVPQIKDVTSAMDNLAVCRFARMSGSGATVFGIFDTATDAAEAAIHIRRRWPDYWVHLAEVSGTGPRRQTQ